MMPDLDGWSVLAACGRMRTSPRFRIIIGDDRGEHRAGLRSGAAGLSHQADRRERLAPRDQPLSVVDAATRIMGGRRRPDPASDIPRMARGPALGRCRKRRTGREALARLQQNRPDLTCSI